MDKCRKCGKMFKGIGRLCPDCQLEVDEKIAKGRKLFNRHGFEDLDIKYDIDNACFKCTNSDGHWVSYNGENWIQAVPAKSLATQLRPNPALETDTKEVELSEQYQREHFDEVLAYAKSEKEDIIKKPNHYCAGRKYEPKDVIRDWDLNFNLGNTVKYISRNGRKDGNSALQDLKKARQYLDFEIEFLESKEE